MSYPGWVGRVLQKVGMHTSIKSTKRKSCKNCKLQKYWKTPRKANDKNTKGSYLIDEVLQFDLCIILLLGGLSSMFAVHGAAWSRDWSRRGFTSCDGRCKPGLLILNSVVDSLVKIHMIIQQTQFDTNLTIWWASWGHRSGAHYVLLGAFWDPWGTSVGSLCVWELRGCLWEVFGWSLDGFLLLQLGEDRWSTGKQ